MISTQSSILWSLINSAKEGKKKKICQKMERKRKMCSLMPTFGTCDSLLEQDELCCQIGNWTFPKAMFTLNSQHSVLLRLTSSLKSTKAGCRGLRRLTVIPLLISSIRDCHKPTAKSEGPYQVILFSLACFSVFKPPKMACKIQNHLLPHN